VLLLAATAPASVAASTRPAVTSSAISLAEAWSVPPPAGTGQIEVSRIAATTDAVYVAGIVGGHLDGETSLGEHDVFVARYSTAGQLVWARHVGTSAADQMSSLTATATSIFVSGSSDSQTGPPAIGPTTFVARLSTSGQVLWQKTEPLDQAGAFSYVAPDRENGVVVAMHTATTFGTPNVRPALVRRYGWDGTVRWEDRIVGCCTAFGNRYGAPQGLSADPGGVTAIVWKVHPSTESDRTYVRRYSWSGQLAWEASIAGPIGDVTSHQVAASSASIWVAGSSAVPITGAPNAFPAGNPFVRRLSFGGATAWTKALAPYVIRPDCSSFVAIGGIPGDASAGTQVGTYLSRLNNDGGTSWRFDRPGTTTTRIDFEDLAVTGTRAYVLERRVTEGVSTHRVVALESVPARADCDTGAPRAGVPTSKLVSGSAISGGRTTMRTTWTGIDSSSGVASYDAAQSTDGGAWATVATGLAAPKLDRVLATGHSYRFRVRAVDRAGNVGAWTYGSTFRLTGYSESNARVRYSGRWTTSASSVYWGGKAKASSQAEARASLTFTGRSVEVVSRKGPGRGKVKIYVDGVLKATVDLYARGSYQNQRVVWAGNWSTAATRTITVRVLGTEFRPRIDLDAFVVGS
jgi:hypothetical protein